MSVHLAVKFELRSTQASLQANMLVCGSDPNWKIVLFVFFLKEKHGKNQPPKRQ